MGGVQRQFSGQIFSAQCRLASQKISTWLELMPQEHEESVCSASLKQTSRRSACCCLHSLPHSCVIHVLDPICCDQQSLKKLSTSHFFPAVHWYQCHHLLRPCPLQLARQRKDCIPPLNSHYWCGQRAFDPRGRIHSGQVRQESAPSGSWCADVPGSGENVPLSSVDSIACYEKADDLARTRLVGILSTSLR
jgi:hypothetical protein